jgi:hypothetical protein
MASQQEPARFERENSAAKIRLAPATSRLVRGVVNQQKTDQKKMEKEDFLLKEDFFL